ncbi:MAG: hypothetical protein JEZ04_16720 [Spirochaetales bacterium]|nr:hypothetical protein [Spirochaetales bacterium]
MIKKIVFICLIILITATAGFAEDFLVNYIEGILEVNEDGDWYELYIGDELSENSIVRLDEDSYAELNRRDDKIRLSRSGTYELSVLLGARSDVRSSGMGTLISGKFKTLIQEDSGKTQSAVGGVRAAEAETVSIDWMSSETAELIADGRRALNDGLLEEAMTYFADAYDFAADSYEEAEALYFMGLTSAIDEDYSSALEHLDEADMENDSEYYTDFYLLKTQLLVESFAYGETYDFLSDFDTEAARKFPGKLQDIYFLYAVASNNTGRRSEAESIIKQLIKIEPSSETAMAAKKYRDNL